MPVSRPPDCIRQLWTVFCQLPQTNLALTTWYTRCAHTTTQAQSPQGRSTSSGNGRTTGTHADASHPLDPELLPKVALVGRPNVGKSALFNRLVGKRVALVHNTPESHVTRDWREGNGRLADLRFTIIDTCGVEPDASRDSIQGRGTELTGGMLSSVDLALMVIDAKAGVTGPDEGLAQWLAKHVPRDRVVLVANKAEGAKAQKAMEETVSDCYRLGYGDPVAVSAATAEGMSDLYVALQPHIDAVTESLGGSRQLHQQHEGTVVQGPVDHVQGVQGSLQGDGSAAVGASETEDELTRPIRLAIVGLPNVGKSTLLNKLLGEERCVTGPEAGLTRDPVMARLTHEGRIIELIDTAGYIGQTKVAGYDDVGGEVATKARHAGLSTVASSHVVALVVDAAAAVKSQKVLNSRELSLVGQVIQEGKSLIVVANKMDALPEPKDRKLYLNTLKQKLGERLQTAGRVQVVQTSAHLGRGVQRLLPAVMDAHKCWSTRVGTGILNRWLKEDILSHTEAGGISSTLKRIKYISQVQVCPPTYICFVVGQEAVPEHVHAYLAGQMRDKFDMRSTPIRFWFRHRVRSESQRLSRRRMRLRQPALPPRRGSLAYKPASASNGSKRRDSDGGDEEVSERQMSARAFMQQRAQAAQSERGALALTPRPWKRKDDERDDQDDDGEHAGSQQRGGGRSQAALKRRAAGYAADSSRMQGETRHSGGRNAGGRDNPSVSDQLRARRLARGESS